MEKLLQISLFFAFIACARMEVVQYDKCANHPDVNCSITEVRVTPCAEAAENKPCVIKRGRTAKIEFDFEPNGNYDGLETRAYWASSTGDLPWIGMDTNGCAHTECPTNPKPESFSYNLQIGSKLPVKNTLLFLSNLYLNFLAPARRKSCIPLCTDALQVSRSPAGRHLSNPPHSPALRVSAASVSNFTLSFVSAAGRSEHLQQTRQYDVKWRLWKEDAMECCFLIKIKLVK